VLRIDEVGADVIQLSAQFFYFVLKEHTQAYRRGDSYEKYNCQELHGVTKENQPDPKKATD